MPVPLNDRDGSRPGDEQGAVAIVVAILLVVLLGISAFAMDFGLAYTYKRQLQTAADAAALAAASIYAEQPGDCLTLRGDSSLEAMALTAGHDVMVDNYRDAYVLVPAPPDCQDDRLEIEWTVAGSTQTGLGGIFGVDDVDFEVRAAAQVGVPGGTGERHAGSPPNSPSGRALPFLVCSDDLPTPLDLSLTGPVVKIQWQGDQVATDACPTEEASGRGDFWAVRCPEESTSGGYLLPAKTASGCDEPVTVVPQTAVSGPALYSELVAGCGSPPIHDSDCLNATSGLMDGMPPGAPLLPANWAGLLGERVFFPVFCGAGTCSPAAFIDTSPPDRDPVYYPVQNLVGVIVCGYDWGDSGAPGALGYDTGNPECSNVNAADLPSAGDGQEDYILIRPVHIPVAGDLSPRDCALGDPCDIGPRGVYLVE